MNGTAFHFFHCFPEDVVSVGLVEAENLYSLDESR